MPPLGGKSKSKGKDSRRSRSRNTTPSSVLSAPPAVIISAGNTAYLEIPVGHLLVPTSILYDDILEIHGGSGAIPDPKHLEALASDLHSLSLLAETRNQACDKGMRELSSKRKDKVEEERELEQANRQAEEKASLKRAAEDEELDRGRKAAKLKKRKDQSRIREERPLNHGAHALAKQDGSNPVVKEPGSSIPTAPTIANTVAGSGSSSSLSPASILQSPIVAIHGHEVGAAQISDGASVSSEDSHQPPPADRIQQYQVFGSDPSTFDDPTIYHIREVIADMTDEEKKEIYCVASFPTDDLSDLIAGIPPDKDFSSAKPSNQVNANTFASYLEPYLRPLTEEDMAFLRERGDRVTPFIMPRRGKKHYTEIWAEEDGLISADTSQNRERLPANQPRGNIEHMDDDISATEQISTGPILSRLLSALRYEHRPSANDEKDKPNGVTNGNGESSTNGIMHGEINGEHGGDATDDRLPPATSFPESTSQGWKIPSIKLDYAQVDERLKAELRHIGFLGPEEEPDYDAHKDDEIAERLRNLQAELKRISIVNGARKARLLDYYKEYMAHQEFTTIRDDLDTQVIQAYLKRNRTLSKGKKNIKRPGGAGGGSHFVAGSSSSGAGTAKPGVGDQVKVLIERRRRWIKVIGPIFDKEMVRVRTGKDSILEEAEMEPYMNAERDKWDEEVE